MFCIDILDQQATILPFLVESVNRFLPFATGEQPYILLFCNNGICFRVYPGSNDHFDKLLVNNCLGSVCIERAIEGYDATKR